MNGRGYVPERRCAWCRWSQGTPEGLFCRLKGSMVGRRSYCHRYEREPGADDE